MRRKRCQIPDEDSPSIDLSSLVDVSFLLLIFFLVTGVIMKKEQELKTLIPAQYGHAIPDPETVRITIEKGGGVMIGTPEHSELISNSLADRQLPELTERIQLLQEITGGRTPFELEVSDKASHQRFTDILNCFVKNGIGRITIVDSSLMNH